MNKYVIIKVIRPLLSSSVNAICFKVGGTQTSNHQRYGNPLVIILGDHINNFEWKFVQLNYCCNEFVH